MPCDTPDASKGEQVNLSNPSSLVYTQLVCFQLFGRDAGSLIAVGPSIHEAAVGLIGLVCAARLVFGVDVVQTRSPKVVKFR